MWPSSCLSHPIHLTLWCKRFCQNKNVALHLTPLQYEGYLKMDLPYLASEKAPFSGAASEARY